MTPNETRLVTLWEQGVPGSNPGIPTLKIKGLRRKTWPLIFLVYMMVYMQEDLRSNARAAKYPSGRQDQWSKKISKLRLS